MAPVFKTFKIPHSLQELRDIFKQNSLLCNKSHADRKGKVSYHTEGIIKASYCGI